MCQFLFRYGTTGEWKKLVKKSNEIAKKMGQFLLGTVQPHNL